MRYWKTSFTTSVVQGARNTRITVAKAIIVTQWNTRINEINHLHHLQGKEGKGFVGIG